MQEGGVVQTENTVFAAPDRVEIASAAPAHRKASVWSEDDDAQRIDLEAALRQGPQGHRSPQ
jgi:hypothetical protein